MADVTATCQKCGTEFLISEFADAGQARCTECGGTLKIPEKHVFRRSQKHLEKKSQEDSQAGGTLLDRHNKPRSTVTAAYAVSDRVKKRRARGTHIWVWTPSKATLLVIFILGTGILSALRYLLLGDEDLDAYRQFGVIAMGVSWLVVVVDAFHDNVMHGLLCVFVPGYYLYYLFTQCDSFLLRVGIGMLLIPFGLDTGIWWWQNIVQGILGWMGAEHLSEDF